MPYKTLTQMTRNMLDPVRGWWDERQLSRVCPVAGSSQADVDAVTAGMVGFLDSSNRFAAGNVSAASVNKIPLFARGGSLDNDAVRYEGNFASQRATRTQGTPALTGGTGADADAGNVGISCLVGTGAYELGTTAFQVAASAIAAGDLLMADTSSSFDSTGAIATAGRGKIRQWAASAGADATYGYAVTGAKNTNQVIGIATSSGGVKNQYGVPMLYFYVNWWPAI